MSSPHGMNTLAKYGGENEVEYMGELNGEWKRVSYRELGGRW